MTNEEMMREVDQITERYLKNHPLDPFAEVNRVMSEDFTFRYPFFYGKQE